MKPEPEFLSFYLAQGQGSIPGKRFRQPMKPEPEFLNFYGAQEPIQDNQFRQAV
jgi:hypothetical protein